MNKLLIILSFFILSMQGAAAQSPPVVSGGVGEEAMRSLLPQQRAYNLKMVLTLREGDYIAGVSVKITDGSGRTVLEHATEGPILLARLPAGKYSAALTYEGVTQQRALTLPAAGLHTVQVRWARSPADGEPLL